MWVTIGGNTFAFARGSARVLPPVTAFLTSIIAASITLLPAVFAVISSPSSIGTPLLVSVPRVLVNLATATLLRSTPNIGSFSKILSVRS